MAGFGYLGEKIAMLLQRENFALTVISRSARSAKTGAASSVSFVNCNLIESMPALGQRDFDTAIFCLAPGLGGFSKESYRLTYCVAQRNFLQAFTARQYIFISSTAVYPDAPGRYEESMAAAHSERAEILLAAERIALEQKKSCVLRLAGLYSADRPIYRTGERDYSEDKLVHFIHRDDAARAVLHAVKHSLHGIYTVHDGNPQLRSAILNRIGAGSTSGTQRWLDGRKFASTGFVPHHADYFQGIRGAQI